MPSGGVCGGGRGKPARKHRVGAACGQPALRSSSGAPLRAPTTTAEPAGTPSEGIQPTGDLVPGIAYERVRRTRPLLPSVPLYMLEITIDKLPGGDSGRRQCLARVTLTNTGQGTGGVKTYDVRITHSVGQDRAGLPTDSCRTFGNDHEDVIRLVHRALGRLLGPTDQER